MCGLKDFLQARALCVGSPLARHKKDRHSVRSLDAEEEVEREIVVVEVEDAVGDKPQYEEYAESSEEAAAATEPFNVCEYLSHLLCPSLMVSCALPSAAIATRGERSVCTG